MDAEDIRKKLEEHDIKRVKVGGFDVDGVLRGKYINAAKFDSAVEKGFGFCDVIFGWDIADVLYDNAKVTGWDTGYPDALARVDLETFRMLPTEPGAAHFLVDFCTEDGKPHPACPRSLLKRVVARAEASGYRPMFSAEFEFWLFRETPQTLNDKGFRDLTPLSPGMFGYSWVRAAQAQELVEDILGTMERYDIEIEGLHTETGPGVWEAALRYDDAVRAADKAALFKTTMKQLCHRHGLSVTFMAKWNAALPGSSGHLHQSLWDTTGKQNLFSDPKAKDSMSTLARRYIGGLVQTTAEMTALYSPFVNSYKRYVPGVWAPMSASWAIDNRTAAIRVINGPGASAARVEYRQTAADINPYVAMAANLAAGLHGIENAIDPPPPSSGDATGASSGREAIPLTLADAVARLERSERARALLGDSFVDHYVRTRDWEVRQYNRAVSEWELRRYFEAV